MIANMCMTFGCKPLTLYYCYLLWTILRFFIMLMLVQSPKQYSALIIESFFTISIPHQNTTSVYGYGQIIIFMNSFDYPRRRSFKEANIRLDHWKSNIIGTIVNIIINHHISVIRTLYNIHNGLYGNLT